MTNLEEREQVIILMNLFGDNYPVRFVLPHLIIKLVGEITHLIKPSFNFSILLNVLNLPPLEGSR